MTTTAQSQLRKLDREGIIEIARFGFISFAAEVRYALCLTFASDCEELVRLCKERVQ